MRKPAFFDSTTAAAAEALYVEIEHFSNIALYGHVHAIGRRSFKGSARERERPNERTPKFAGSLSFSSARGAKLPERSRARKAFEKVVPSLVFSEESALSQLDRFKSYALSRSRELFLQQRAKRAVSNPHEAAAEPSSVA